MIYYIPNIDEYHVGFNYEFNDGDDINPKWIPTFVTDRHDLGACNKSIKSRTVRVKHLDIKDIEDCRWKLKSDVKPTYFFKKGVFNLIFNETNGAIVIDKDTELVLSSGEKAPNMVLLQMLIRNKSELIKMEERLETYKTYKS